MADAETFGVKLSPYIVRKPQPVITAWTLLMSTQTGQPLLLCDAGRLTTERTAGVTALAVDLLAPPDARTLAIVGTGAAAEAHLRHVLQLRAWETIRITSRRVAQQPAASFERFTARDARVELRTTVVEAARDADVVLLCTSSGVSVFDPSMLSRPALITSISTNVARAHEIPPEALPSLDVYCDYRATAPLSAGEMVIAREQHAWSPEAILGDLPELVSGAAVRRDSSRHAFFRAIGMGLEDIAVATELHRVLAGQAKDPRR
jgi:L-arginine dehydrogenase